jgi:hypothetical protein
MCQVCWESEIRLAAWDRAYINALPDAAFAYVEPAYKRGETKNKNARHLPHHAKEVKNGRSSSDHIDMPHLRNALARVDQIKPVTQSVSKERLVAQARAHLEKHAKELKIGGRGEKKEEKQSVQLASEQLQEFLAPKGIELLSDGRIFTRCEGQLLTVDSEQFRTQDLQARLAEREDGQISAADFEPKPEDFIRAEFRALSKIILPMRFFDFTKGNVLKNATKLLQGVTFYPDHRAQVENWLGIVEKTWWDEEGSPQGINAAVKIDAFANPKITRGILAGALGRVSTTIWFLWEKSHDLDDREFINLLGSDLDGEIVRFIVNKITGFGEFSLVWYGADPHAKSRGKVKVGEEK